MTPSLANPDTIAPLLAEGKLSDGIATATAVVKANPNSAKDRILLAELLVLQGAHERADNQLKLAGDNAPAEQIAISQMRWLLRGAEARRAWYEERGVPEFIGEPSQRQRDVMRLALFVRDGEAEEAAVLRARLEEEAPAELVVDGCAPAPLRDVCDLSQHGFEALTLDGRYLWIAPEQVVEMRLAPAKRPRDLVWCKAETVLADGREAVFYLVAQYYDPEAGELHRLAKETDWHETIGGVVRGRGQKILLAGDEDHGLLDIAHIAGHAM